ncbi:PQQ-dependent sugar dehydrogenase [Allosphingosinicella indica]|uniref:Glucose/arabinose dehydrogenase, beta-propeller fold n=1 Tax=Allosphingosinicella indica TaxID=941907 RepID=A0A1X7G169_9SPHN|nr:PQQ-dependent sugar dehydrogenase [Allosphingosinicella indica]SMF61623.1 Glucose/arabinose dehydrogenase, beta-propeller fold [Allosphingosinicella indica]
MRLLPIAALPVLIAACSGGDVNATGNQAAPTARTAQTASADGKPFRTEVIAQFAEPWAMTFIPGTGNALITEKKGVLKLWQPDGAVIDVAGVPKVAYGGQGGLGDVVLHPDFASNNLVYLSFVEAGEGSTSGAAVGRGKLVTDGNTARIDGFQVIWRQAPKVEGQGHYGHRMAFSPDGHLFITNGDRQKFDPAQDDAQTLGKIVRLTDSGAVPADNPYASEGGVKAQQWTKGHRNPLGLAFDAQGRLWSHEMGPAHGDELNLIVQGKNYGYPIVSNGNHYDGRDIPDHSTRPEFEAPKAYWDPAISPAGLMIYSGDMFPAWKGSAFIGGMNKPGLVRVELNGTEAQKADVFDLDGQRIREIEQGPDGAIYILEDGGRGSKGRLLKLTPAQ